jgi:hypothetical protein
MFLSRRRIVLIGTIAAIGGVIVLLPAILTITLPDLTKVGISIGNIELNGLAQNNTATLTISFNINNPTTQALTTSKIDYSLYINGHYLGNHTISYEDIPVNGRPQIIPQRDTPIPSTISLPITDEKILNEFKNSNQTLKGLDWKVEGTAIIESGFSESPKQFTAVW